MREYLSQLERLGELRLVEGADWDLEMGTITELSEEMRGPALLFDKIKGYPGGYRVVSNLIAQPRRMAVAVGLGPEARGVELVRRIKEKFKSLQAMPPVEVPTGPILENVQQGDAVNILQFPVPRWHEYDGGRFIGTADMVIMRDPDENWVNAGTYRVQVHDGKTLGLYITPGHHGRLIREKYWARGQSCPVAVVFGVHPAVWIPACMGFPWGAPELNVSGALLGKPVEVIRGEYTGLPVPAYSEIAIEGDCPPPETESRREGPFGEWPGYYGSGAREEPVIRIKRVMYRNDPILFGAPPLKPPASANGIYLIHAANVWRELEVLGIPGIKGVWAMRPGSSRYWNVVSIEQKYAGHAKQVAMAAMCGPESAWHSRFAVVVDDDIDPSNDEDVLWAIATRCDPATSIEIIRDCWSTPLDPILSPEKKATGNLTSSRALILACRPFHWMKDFPRVNRASDELRATVRNKWKDLFPRR